MTTCRGCRKELNSDDKFCQECGSSQTQQCESCGTELQIIAKFCSECGREQTLATTQPENTEPEERSSPSQARGRNAVDTSVGDTPVGRSDTNASFEPVVPTQNFSKRQPSMVVSTHDATSDIPIAAYQEFEQAYLLDPRTLRTATVMGNLVKIVEAEGPIIARRAYSIYAKNAGLHKVGRQLRAIFDKALNEAISEGHLSAEDEWGSSDQQELVIRVTGTPGISIRMAGSRILDEIPPREIAALMDIILAKSPLGEEALFRKVLQLYEIGRLTRKAQDILEFAHRIEMEQSEL